MQKGILLFLVISFVVLSLFLFFRSNNKQDYDRVGETSENISKKNQVKDVQTKNKKIDLKTTYSRISFFLTKPVYASLSIPSNWEGKYRMKESGDTVSFLYINSDNGIKPIFSVQLSKQNSNNKAFASKYGYDFISVDDLSNDSTNNELRGMRNQVKTILDSIKIFKIN